MKDVDALWRELCALQQLQHQAVDEYLSRFIVLWNRWQSTLHAKVPPRVIKKDKFIDGLWFDLRVKVECNELDTFEDAIIVAKEKERKQIRMAKLSLGGSIIPGVSDKIAPVAVESPKMEARKEETMQQEIYDEP